MSNHSSNHFVILPSEKLAHNKKHHSQCSCSNIKDACGIAYHNSHEKRIFNYVCEHAELTNDGTQLHV
jgi:hypothetical protein